MNERVKSTLGNAGNLGTKKPVKSSIAIKKPEKKEVAPEQLPKVAPEQLTENSPIEKVAPEQLEQKVAPEQLPKSSKKQANSSSVLRLSDITPWGFADRPEDEFGDNEEWHEFVQSIAKEGVDQPVTVRKKKSGKGFELICGRRRYTASLECGKETIPVLIRSLSDKEAAMLQDRENEKRLGLSSWARAMNWKRLLSEGVFERQDDLAAAVGVSKDKVSKILSFTKIPDDIANAITNKSGVSIKLAQAIISLTKVSNKQSSDEVKRNTDVIISIADKISADNMSPAKLMAAITKAASHKDSDKNKPEFSADAGTVKGVKCYNVRRDSNGTPVISLLKEGRELASVNEIIDHLNMMFEDAIK